MNLKAFSYELFKNKILQFGNFTLKDGSQSRFYLDLRILPSYPSLFKQVIKQLELVINQNWTDLHAVAGIMSAGVPYATGLMMAMNLPLLQIRKEQKSYGGKKQVEGLIPDTGRNVLLLDDVITSGTSKTPAIHAIRRLGLHPIGVLVVIDRSFGKVQVLEEQEGIPVKSMITAETIFQLLLNHEHVDDATKTILQDILHDLS